MALPLLLGQLLALMGHGGAFYLEVRELEEKCFIQEIPDGTVVIGARAGHSLPCPPCTQSPERGRNGAPWHQLRPAPSLPCWGVGSGLGPGRNEWTAVSPRHPLFCVCRGWGRGAEEARLIQTRLMAEKWGWRGEEKAEARGQAPQTRDPSVPPPTTTTRSWEWMGIHLRCLSIR